jgi:predicted metalloprotease
VEIEGRRRSSNFEDRGRGAGGGGAAGIPVQALFAVVRLLGVKGTVILAAIAGIGYFLMPSALKQQLFGAQGSDSGAQGAGSVCQASAANGKACDFSRVVLASTEDVWTQKFQAGELPSYGRAPGAYSDPTLVVFADSVATGCGGATAAVGPFYCPRDRKLYIDPSFYDLMAQKLHAPGDFAQAYVIAHEVGHHVQNLIGATDQSGRGETQNQVSVRVELQADCFAGVWGHTARASLDITDADLDEATTAAHNIGDDALGHSNEREYTHGTSAQRKRWFRRGFDSGDARQCDTFAVKNHAEL